ncbi:MAG: bifunctional methylenetetrahydrofolate dehydrogenase/methenyltetrahydrofolate cyclohydrolase FolD [Bacteroidales bacterium]|nr:bifunctional methylenetetrahydrofolate dehydrogenase/methenyltetrahydrofolate cyclohydrolase FolD [Bacteroidales bacterium]
MATILDGKALASEIRGDVALKVSELTEKYGRAPHLAVILVGEDPASTVYVRNKAIACEKAGIRNTTVNMPEETPEADLLATIDRLNKADDVDGILVQLPLPGHISEDKVIEAIDKGKDVDGFHPLNVAGLWQKTPHIEPCTPMGVMMLLDAYNIDPKGKRAVVVGRSKIVGLPVAKMLLDRNATVTLCHTRTVNLADEIRRAEILIAAAGRPKMITGDMIAPGAVVIDVGINRDPETGKLCGDVDYDTAAEKASAITPVPGGVGPMTIACLLLNTLRCFERRLGDL